MEKTAAIPASGRSDIDPFPDSSPLASPQHERDAHIDTRGLKEVMAHFATGVVVVSALDGPDPVGFACQSFVSLSLEPPLVAIAAARTSTSWPRIARSARFCVNILSSDQHEVCRAFAQSGGDKFRSIEWQLSATGSPQIEGAIAWVDCEIESVHETGDHELAIARVRGIERREATPLLYFRSGFGNFEPLAR
ncbi:MAG: NADPH-flavin oxidoreductase [Acidimicrobiaceae bacterium]|jgi:3-hydroxy-9,10-secoandrosta-1,3,5(10)-triene-9,17-dione monooxygenase reductase component|nr:NADPH-flavin oxidoreductase [Acidimicrobiaceae bacterium]